jgi:Tol biopolymer transport system component/DNA-binding winged helix-turn-helix (wHTH) protein
MARQTALERQIYEFGPFRLNATGRELLRGDRLVPLPPKVLDTLVLLIENRGQLVEKDELLRSIWPDTYVEQNSLMHNISVLRKVLGDAPDGKSYIETAPRRGYRFVGTVRIAGNEAVDGEPGRARPSRPVIAVAAGLLIVLVAGVAISMKPAVIPPFEITPLTSYPGTEAYPTFSPDGRQVAFSWNGEKQDQFDIYVKTLGVDSPRRLTSDLETECHLAWSADGAWIAFNHCGSTEPGAPAGQVGLYVIPSSGGPKRRIAYVYEGGNPFGRTFTWAPSSKALISAKALGGSADTGLVLLSIETTAELRRLTSPERGNWDDHPAVSPDGRTLAFVRWRAHGISDIYLLSLDKGLVAHAEPRRLTFKNDFIRNLLWTNDGVDLLYAAGNEGTGGVWRVRARPGATPIKVPALTGAVDLALSSQGKLAYALREWDFDIWRAGLDANVSPRTPAALIASTFTDAEPRYSPDGKSIAFISNRSGAMEIWRSKADGTAATQATSLRGEAGSPNWSPDGAEIAFDCRLEGNVDVYVSSVADGKIRRLTTDPGVHTTPSWSRDGRWIYFASKRTGRLEVWRAPSHGGGAMQVTKSGGFFASESADGKYLFYAKTGDFPAALWRKSLETGEEEQIIDSMRDWSAFAVFADGIYFIPNREPAAKFPRFQVDFYDLSNRSIRAVAEVDKWSGVGFAISPDRRWVLFAPSETHGGDLMLVENFR